MFPALSYALYTSCCSFLKRESKYARMFYTASILDIEYIASILDFLLQDPSFLHRKGEIVAHSLSTNYYNNADNIQAKT